MKRIISSVLAIITVLSCFTFGLTFGVSAAEDSGTSSLPNYEQALKDAVNQKYINGKEKIDSDPNMKLMVENGEYALYCNEFTGEVAYHNLLTDQVLTSNPTNLSSLLSTMTEGNYKTENQLTKLLSQVEISFVDNQGKTEDFYSFVEAAYRDQIEVKQMVNGFRVEYIMGRLNTTYLLPGVVLESDYREKVFNLVEAKLYEVEDEYGMDSEAYDAVYTAYMKLDTWYHASNYDTEILADFKADMAAKYPDVYKPGGQTIYYLDESTITDREKVYLENLIKTYCPDLTQDMLDTMHGQTGYVQVNDETPVFRVAIEYVLDEDGSLSVRLPASSIRFDETKYTLNYVKILQYFGAGDLLGDGYVFYPDGSGAIVEFDDFYSKSNNNLRESVELSATVYGEDFAYYDIDTNAKHSETIRMPVFGISSETSVNSSTKRDSGFLAILEEGDALADISASFGGTVHNFASAYAVFYPRPSDSYNLSEAISVADNKEMTIVSDKKYTGFYRLRYVMLFDDAEVGAIRSTGYNEASYVGMATAYRNYLVENNYLNALKKDDVEDQLPIYIETFGSIETTKKIMSIPVTVDVALTTFDDVERMYNKLKDNGISNVNFKLTGFANGGMNYSYPKKLKWVNAVGGKSGFEDLLTIAKTEGFGVYPDFNFSYVLGTAESGIRLKKHAARAVDDRYCSKQVYNAIYQEFTTYFDICVSPSSILEYVEKFADKYTKYEPIGISVSTLAGELNSDFNEDNSLNRADAKDYMVETLGKLEKTYNSVMSEGGNIYSIQYLDHLLRVPVDSSNFKWESRSVPFMGMVLHGYVNYAGYAINESGDGEYQLLKSIENGALLYYMLIYQNSNLLKEDEFLSKYYSVRFDIWFDTILDQYNTLNDAIGDLQLYNIVDHHFIMGDRIPTEKEEQMTVDAFNAKLNQYLATAYTNLLDNTKRELHIKQVASSLATQKTFANEEDFINEVVFCLGYTLSDDQLALVKAVYADPLTESLNGTTVSVAVDKDALIASLSEILAKTGETVTEDQIKLIEKFAEKNSKDDGDVVVTLDAFDDSIPVVKNYASYYSTDEYDASKKYSEYLDASGRITMVTYSDGKDVVYFVLNYNTYDVSVRFKGANGEDVVKTVSAYKFVRIDEELIID